MAPKKSAFFIFLASYRDDEIKNGRKPSNFQQLRTELTPIWNNMTVMEKNKFKDLAKKYNSNFNKEQPLLQISDQHKNSYDFWNMEKYITEMFECIPNNQELLNKKFILLHINCHSHDGEQYYFPAEIAALEFNLKNGIFRTYHQMIGISKISPKGLAGGMRVYADHFHQINSWNDHPDDYQNILLEFSTFLKDEQINDTDLKEGTLNLPYLFTIQSEVGTTNMMKVKSSLERLYSIAFPEVKAEHCKSMFKIGSIEQLLLEIKKKMNLQLDQQNSRLGLSVTNILESDLYGKGLGCLYHELREISFKCSKARIVQWMSNICIHINTYFNLNLVPGRHMAAQLDDGSKLMIENAHLPLTAADLKLTRNTSYDD
ncbi:protein maelstrom homolog isoform X2 [Melanaphis sacchari]|uniref:Protein maelstrom n=2 Tax=Melanaphis sacchari TaxID=742174 RepID=A0A2H8TRV4_9HEMI|nr:protein maelstrom homolog isoform X2 [Melanaphis sacchari]